MTEKKCDDCGDKEILYQVNLNDFDSKGNEIIYLCEECYKHYICCEVCQNGFICSETGVLACKLRPTGKKEEDEFGYKNDTFWEVEPKECPKNMFDCLVENWKNSIEKKLQEKCSEFSKDHYCNLTWVWDNESKILFMRIENDNFGISFGEAYQELEFFKGNRIDLIDYILEEKINALLRSMVINE